MVRVREGYLEHACLQAQHLRVQWRTLANAEDREMFFRLVLLAPLCHCCRGARSLWFACTVRLTWDILSARTALNHVAPL